MAISLSIKDASKESGLSVRMIYRLIGAGKLQSTMIGRRRLIVARSLTELVTRGLRSTAAGSTPEGGAKKKRRNEARH